MSSPTPKSAGDSAVAVATGPGSVRPISVSATGLSTPGVTQRNNGADFGPDTPGTTTSGSQEALLAAAGKTKVVYSGKFTFSQTMNVPSNSILEFADATVCAGASVNLFTFNTAKGGNHIRIVGRLTVLGNNTTATAFRGIGTPSDVTFDWACTAKGFANGGYLITTGGGSNFTIRGQTFIDYDAPLRFLNTNFVRISGIRSVPGGFTNASYTSPIGFFTNQQSGTSITGCYIDDVVFDGGFSSTGIAQKGHPQIDVAGAVAGTLYTPIKDVRLSNITLSNLNSPTTGPHSDGIDVQTVIGFQIDSIHIDTGGDGIALQGSDGSVSNCTFKNCQFGGLQFGDPAMLLSIANITVTGVTVTDCGQKLAGGARAGFLFYGPPHLTVENVTLNDCVSLDTTGSAQAYGIGFAGDASNYHNIRVNGGRFHGFAASFFPAPELVRGTFVSTGANGITV
jgi:hypothetical protein